MKKKPTSRSELETKINMTAWTDPQFKKRLISSPHETLREFGMSSIPNKMRIEVKEEAPDSWILVLRKPPLNAHNLSEDELMNVAAGQQTYSSGCD